MSVPERAPPGSQKPETIAAQGGGAHDAATGAMVMPIHLATNYAREADNRFASGRIYTRCDNPTYDPPQEMLRQLERGADCFLFSSGMAAAAAAFTALGPGRRMVISDKTYYGVRHWIDHHGVPWGLKAVYVDATDLGKLEAALAAAPTDLLWLETPANPVWRLVDIEAAAALAHRYGARVAVDSSAATPILTRPVELGADLVMHSATKYLNGHADVLGGALVCARKDDFWSHVEEIRFHSGSVLGPFEAWLLARGMRTLGVRMHRACDNALAIARFLAGHPAIEHVLYPGLPSHPDHALAVRQMGGRFSGMISCLVRGSEADAVGVAARVRLFQRATSFGSVESLIEHHPSIQDFYVGASHLPRNFLRLSVGIEDVDDLIADLAQALAGS